MPTFTTPLHEFNACHEPAGQPTGGQFCADTVKVGITSARPKGDPDYRANKQVFADMRAFESRLKALPGVRAVSVKPGLGAWEGGNEATWAVSYRGNGEATKLLAETGKRYQQDAVLLLKGCTGPGCDAAVELVFDRGVSANVRDAIHDVLTSERSPDGGLVIGGWTWLKRNGRPVLRMVSVPDYGGDAARHTAATARISQTLQGLGLTHQTNRQGVRVTLMQREGPHAYDTYLAGRGTEPPAARRPASEQGRGVGG
jgi:hypothetical protein